MKSFRYQDLNSDNIDSYNLQISRHGLLIENASVIHPGAVSDQSLLLDKNGSICHDTPEEYSHETPVLNARNLKIFPGAIDIHTHPRDGEQSHKETWESLGEAAIAGGVTSAFGMPNTSPLTDTVDKLQYRHQLAARSPINYAEYIGTLGNNRDEILHPWTQKNAAGIKEYLDETTGNFTLTIKEAVRLALQTPRAHNQLIHTLHAEGKSLHEAALPLLEVGHHVHVAHISLAHEVELVRKLQAKGFPISAEVAPHHLLISIENIRQKVREGLCDLCVMKPPLSPSQDLPELFRGLRDGTIMSIATDHAPHTLAEKKSALLQGKKVFGLPGIQEMLPLMLTHLPDHNFSYSEISRLLSSNAASRFHIKNRGHIRPGNRADLTFINMQNSYQIGDKNHPISSRCGWSVYQDWPVQAEVALTMVNGRLAFANNSFSRQIHSSPIEFRR